MSSPFDPAKSPGSAAGLLAPLFDFSFAVFLTPRLIRILYFLGLFAGFVLAIVAIAAAFKISSYLGIFTLFFSPVIFLFTLTYTRVVLELVAVIFRVEEHLRRLPSTASF